MIVAFAVFVALGAAYLVFVAWARRQARQVLYHPFWSPVLRFFTGGQMGAITLWNWSLLLLGVAPLSAAGLRHEDTHVRQFAGNPYGFPFVYFWALVRHGYNNNPYEVAARAAESGV